MRKMEKVKKAVLDKLVKMAVSEREKISRWDAFQPEELKELEQLRKQSKK